MVATRRPVGSNPRAAAALALRSGAASATVERAMLFSALTTYTRTRGTDAAGVSASPRPKGQLAQHINDAVGA